MSRRIQTDAFGLSFLDLLCCGLGAVTLLLVLTRSALEQRLWAAQGEVRGLAQELGGERDRLVTVEAGTLFAVHGEPPLVGRDVSIRGESGRLQLQPQRDVRSVVIVLDMSGSMNWYGPASATSGRPDTPGPKWNDAISFLHRALLSFSNLERFSVVGLGDGQRAVCEIAERWREQTPKNGMVGVVHRTIDELQAVVPWGGSNHHDAFRRAFDLVEESGGIDMILILTDGLPNHGPSASRTGPAHPQPTDLVPPESKRDRAQAALDYLKFRRQRLDVRRIDQPVVSVVCAYWPDDAELSDFAFRLARPFGGLVVMLPAGRDV